jgi:hypothetical protein
MKVTKCTLAGEMAGSSAPELGGLTQQQYLSVKKANCLIYMISSLYRSIYLRKFHTLSLFLYVGHEAYCLVQYIVHGQKVQV